MLRIAQLQRDSMAFQESQDTAREFKSAVQIVSRPPDQSLNSEFGISGPGGPDFGLRYQRRITDLSKLLGPQ